MHLPHNSVGRCRTRVGQGLSYTVFPGTTRKTAPSTRNVGQTIVSAPGQWCPTSGKMTPIPPERRGKTCRTNAVLHRPTSSYMMRSMAERAPP